MSRLNGSVLVTLEHVAKEDLDSGQCAQVLDSSMLVLAFDGAGMVLLPKNLALPKLCNGESAGIWELQIGLALEPPDTQ